MQFFVVSQRASSRRFLVPLFLCSAFILSPSLAGAAMVLVGDAQGRLTGIHGVEVAGRVYDVDFVRDSCAAVYQGCDEATDFTFTTQAAGLAAAQALIDSAFLARDQIQQAYASLCGANPCMPLTPYALFVPGPFGNTPPPPLPLVHVAGAFVPYVVGNGTPLDTVIDSTQVFTDADYYLMARWSEVPSPVPLPPALLPLVSGLLLFAALGRWRRA